MNGRASHGLPGGRDEMGSTWAEMNFNNSTSNWLYPSLHTSWSLATLLSPDYLVLLSFLIILLHVIIILAPKVIDIYCICR